MPSADLIPSYLAASDVLGTGWFAAVAAEAGPGKTVVVVGDGAVGLLAVLAAKQLGAERIIRYLTRPALRHRIRDLVIDAIEEHRPTALVAHSLGTVVAYEALHERPDLAVDTFVTCGSPLGLPGTVFEALDPEPIAGRGARPPDIRQWINVADVGDLVAIPVEVGGRFPVDRHDPVHVGIADFHTFGGYLSTPATATAVESAR